MTGAEQEVLDAAASLVAAFADHDTEAYFDCFAADATFFFHTTERLLGSRAEYQRLWTTWEDEADFRVLSCASTDQHVRLLDDTAGIAVFTHRVSTVVRSSEGDEVLDEQETIVFRKSPDGRWLAVHEHLSPAPGQHA